MAFQRVVFRTLPDGHSAKVYPFHVSLEGMESVLLCRDEEDYDQLIKGFHVSAWKCNCLVVIDIAMSNHGHVAILAPSMDHAVMVGELIKKRHSQFIAWKYNEPGVLSGSRVDVRYLDYDSYVRNALAYIPRNALDAHGRIEDYPWSGYRGMFVEGKSRHACRRVSALSRRERESLFRTHADLSGVPWLINSTGNLEPASTCDWQYLESAFNHDQAFFLKTIGTVNVAEMRQKLVENMRRKHTDMEMMTVISEMADKFYSRTVPDLSPDMKAKMITYLYRSYRTSVPQLARCLQLPRDLTARLVPVRNRTVVADEGGIPEQVTRHCVVDDGE